MKTQTQARGRGTEENTNPKKTLLVSGDDKGGVTKSASTGAVADALRTYLGYQITLGDGDPANQTLSKIWPDASIVDTAAETALDDYIASVAAGDQDLAILDMPGVSGKPLKNYFFTTGFDFLDEMGLRLVIALTLTETGDAIDGALSWVDTFLDKAEFVIFANERDTAFGRSFDLATNPDTQTLLGLAENRVIRIPRMQDPMKDQYNYYKAPPSAFAPGGSAAKALKLTHVQASRWRTLAYNITKATEPLAPWLTGKPVPMPMAELHQATEANPESQSILAKLKAERDRRRQR